MAEASSHGPKRPTRTRRKLLATLRERAKELNCLYEVEEILRRTERPLQEVLQAVLAVIPPAWQYPEICRAAIRYEAQTFTSTPFEPTPWRLSADITINEQVVGTLSVFYVESRPEEDDGPFLKEEARLVQSIAQRLGHYALYQRMRDVRHTWVEGSGEGSADREPAWRGPLRLLRESDQHLYMRVTRKMLNHLCRIGVRQAGEMLPDGNPFREEPEGVRGESNVPGPRRTADTTVLLSDRPFELASAYLSDEEMLGRVQKWVQEDKASAFTRVLHSPRSSLPEIVNAMRRFLPMVADGSGLAPATLKSLRVSLTQRLLTEQLDFVRVAKEFVEITDFGDLLDRMILPTESHGRLGGKSAGLLLAHKVLQRTASEACPIGEVKVPTTWYLASDGLLEFVAYNDLQDVVEQKFKEIDQVRQDYANIIQLFKNSPFPPRITAGLSAALDDIGEVPLIIRSSSLLEDRLGTAFSGKYKSLFLANQGTKPERLAALLDAIAEVYASTFGPDPIEYRRERGLLEFDEEMGILIQEVVGRRAGKYYLPAFAGVAFSHNEFRWSPRIKREDGLLRLVPGLGTRAVDRVSDDYPILIVPGKPNLRANVALEEIIRYSPRYIDVLNLEARTLETLEIRDLLREIGTDYPAFEKVFSVLTNGMLQRPVGLLADPEKDEFVATFEPLVAGTPFVAHLGHMLQLLQEHLNTPVDIEFAHNGTDFYLLQCRPQSSGEDATPAPIPKDVSEEDILFSATRHVSNGWVPDITHVVYIDPQRYAELESRNDLLSVGRAVGRLNKLLPKRQFILMGPGRWGSRGDIKLGVSVTYADISNTAMLIEIARKKGQYMPDLSFGTHFFQDLVESRIRYLPLYPDDPGIHFNERFLGGAPNLFPTMVPEYAHLKEVVRVIDVVQTTDGRVLRVLMNADLDEALGLLQAPEAPSESPPAPEAQERQKPAQYWRWRLRMAERIAEEIDPERFGVVALYVFGSTKNATAGPGSDIDLLVHVRGDAAQRAALVEWLDGWSLCLAEMNYLRTGYRTDRLLDVHLVTDEDIARRTSYAVKIGAVTDAARELPMIPGKV